MKNFLFDDFVAENSITNAKMEAKRLIDIRDAKWGHPDLQEGWWAPGNGFCAAIYSQDLPYEERKANKEKVLEIHHSFFPGAAYDDTICKLDKYTISGCCEEPDAQVDVLVYTPVNAKKRKNRALFYIMGGCLVIREAVQFDLDKLAYETKSVVVTVEYRTSEQAEYPAALNDLHAGYQWMLDNADDLAINPDNVVVEGYSSGAQLALNLGFRLKRYGITPKGVLAVLPQTGCQDEDHLGVYNGNWDTINQHDAVMQYLGRNAGNSLVGPEALANFATVEDCIGYPPTFIHTVELDPDRNFSREFFGKLLEAQSFAEYHVWGGMHHMSPLVYGVSADVSLRAKSIIDGNRNDLFQYDFRRPWVLEEYVEGMKEKIATLEK